MKRALCLALVWSLISCERFASSSSPSPPEPIPEPLVQIETETRPAAEITISEINLGSCLNLPLLLDRLSNPEFDYPSALMITGFNILDGDLVSSNGRYLAYSSFYYRTAPARELVPFANAEQTDCKTLKLKMASAQNLTFNILESSDRHLKFKLSEDFGDEVPNYQRDALFKRYQPDEISIYIVSELEIRIEKKIRSFDPLCKKKKRKYDLNTTEIFSWRRTPEELPESYLIEREYLALVLSALKTPPVVDPEKPVSVITIKELMLSSPLDEIKLCNL